MKTARNTDFFRQFNGAFFQGDRQFIEESIAEDIVWTIVGSEPIKGKQAFLDVAFGVDDGYTDMEYTTELSLTNGREAALKGKMIRKGTGDVPKIYAYCDFYVLDDEDEGKIKEMTTFVVELKE
ncbi:nuclear transport factor 2 family protein [Planococcus sp. SE5232]|uniref:nuclear transport factor 2 family protein n=1 Tax=unclassified Planococcus (in: firmicutes) TaxID=2662419 RepID=UPI00261D6B4D|nr:nuclear transport factor 2 family protein [uncultured Planococcus sp.]